MKGLSVTFEGGDGVTHPEVMIGKLRKYTLWINPHSRSTHSHVRNLQIYLDNSDFLKLVNGYYESKAEKILTGYLGDGENKYPLTVTCNDCQAAYYYTIHDPFYPTGYCWNGASYEGWYQVELLGIPKRPKRIEFCCSWSQNSGWGSRYAYGVHFKITENETVVYDVDIPDGLPQYNNLVITCSPAYSYIVNTKPDLVQQPLITM